MTREEPSGRLHGGFHSDAPADFPYLFVDACMQIWPDADLARAHRHGVAAYAVTAFRPHDDVAAALDGCLSFRRIVARHPNLLSGERTEDVRAAHRDGRAALILASQGGDFVGRKLERVEALRRVGLRMMSLVYNASNQLGGGCLDRGDAGLTRLGQRVVDECNRVGIVLDGTHTSKRTSLDVIDRSEHPCVFSHSNPSGLVPSPRNIDDEQIRACVARDGVVCLAPWGPLVLRPGTERWPTVDDFLDMIDYVADLTGGVDGIGIGTDMSLGSYPDRGDDPGDGPDDPDPTAAYARTVTADRRSPRRYLDGFNDYAEIAGLAHRLLARGYDEADVRKILGENLLRVFDTVWPAGERI